ncbi:protocadherin Fat 4 [Aethina tumida]|uniref:protocadherin Fat 4 n=1 Tax=Aethina tumida TaxID=116153 RepID=UPI002148B085|nr:protocadherin Fat 4 [Aethina tumida]
MCDSPITNTNYDDTTVVSIQFVGLDTFEFKQEEVDNEIKVIATSAFDYENIVSEHKLIVLDENVGNIVNVILHINNIDDTAPVIKGGSCKLDETKLYTKDDTPCVFELTDADQMNMDKMKFIFSEPAFNIDFKSAPTATDKSSNIAVATEYELNYKEQQVYIIDLTVQDFGNNEGSAQIIINVNDLPNEPPVWQKQLISKKIKEKEAHSYIISARDGDYGINNPIKFKINQPGEYITLDDTENSTQVHVAAIDRDATNLDEYNFTIIAYEVGDETSTLSDEILFIIEDIDDNDPLISLEKISDIQCSDSNIQTIETHQYNDDQSVTLNICENFDQSLPLNLTVKDRDTGNNARFKVQLAETKTGNEYTSAFKITPNAGYLIETFDISVSNQSKLNYEGDELWRKIEFKMVSVSTNNDTKRDEWTININLLDYNDESPMFESSSYNFNLDETAKLGDQIGKVVASDADEGDIVTYKISGSLAEDCVDIDKNGILTVKKENAFDYDVLNTLMFQVIASDSVHEKSASVTINLIDKNNKPPSVNVNQTIEIDENQEKDKILDVEITASSTFAEAKLGAEIDWDQSSVRKNYQIIKMEDKMKCLSLVINEDEGNKLSIGLKINNDYGPDFEEIDTINMMLIINNPNFDKDFPEAAMTKLTIVINIKDVNDNPPEFTEQTKLLNRTVSEGAAAGTSVRTIIAKDKDINSNITYSIEPKDISYDWITVDQYSGELTVKPGSDIDADTNKIEYIHYTATAYDDDETHKDSIDIDIYILDENNKKPTLDDSNKNIKVVEETADGQTVYIIKYEDKDRDVSYNTVECQLVEGYECYQQLSINFTGRDNHLIIKDRIDRDVMTHNNIDCYMKCWDNPDFANNKIRNNVEQEFTITVEDINDNEPTLDISSFSLCENDIKDKDLITFTASDPDEGLNGTVQIILKKVIRKDDQDFTNKFTIISDTKEGNKNGVLQSKVDLKDYYGTYIMTINLEDQGTPPLSSSKDITMIINKYVFNPPRFIFPDKNDIKVELKMDQTEGKPLKLLKNNEDLENIEASYLSDGKCSEENNKFPIKFSITGGDNSGMFKLSTVGTCSAQLQITNKFKPINGEDYDLTIEATIVKGEGDEGDNITTKINLILVFIEITDPWFVNSDNVTLSMFENDETQVSALNTTVTYGSETADLDYYFHLKEYENLFAVSKTSDNIYINTQVKLKYEVHNNYDFTIVVTRYENSNESQDKRSYKNINIEVIDTNNYPPYFIEDVYLGAVMYQYKMDTVITVNANDTDTVGNILTYKMSNVQATGKNIDIDKPFSISNTSGDVKPNFEVTENMEGYFTFTVTVTDTVDPYGNGPYETTTPVTILVISQNNILIFRFDNDENTIINQKTKILDIVESVLGYQARSISITQNKVTTYVDVSMYFIQNNAALLASDVLKELSDVKKFRTLKEELRNESLLLLNFESDANEEDLTALLKAWLISVSVILGALCIILIVVFILRNRQLTRRISQLTNNKFGSDESINKRRTVNAPGTNLHASEGTNPVLTKQDHDNEKVDKISVASVDSGDSDLMGIEDNGQFEFNTNSPGI